MEGKLHIYHDHRRLNLFEYTPRSLSFTAPGPQAGGTRTTTTTPPNVLLFVGGLYDNFSSPEYVNDLAVLFPRHDSQQWTVMHVQMSSAMRGFGLSNLYTDVDEIATCVQYIRDVLRGGQPTQIVLMGHSTGCQDTLHYLYHPGSHEQMNTSAPPRPQVQGAILQAPVSDRDAIHALRLTDPEKKACYQRCLRHISTVPESEYTTHTLPVDWTEPMYGFAPLSVARFLDLASPTSPDKPRIDDVFSHDLHDARLDETFGRVGSTGVLSASPKLQRSDSTSLTWLSMLILISEDDERISHPLKTGDLFARWGRALSSPAASGLGSGVDLHEQSRLIPDAEHDLSGEDITAQRSSLVIMREAVLKYIDDVVGGVDDVAWAMWREGVQKVEKLETRAGGKRPEVGAGRFEAVMQATYTGQ